MLMEIFTVLLRWKHILKLVMTLQLIIKFKKICRLRFDVVMLGGREGWGRTVQQMRIYLFVCWFAFFWGVSVPISCIDDVRIVLFLLLFSDVDIVGSR